MRLFAVSATFRHSAMAHGETTFQCCSDLGGGAHLWRRFASRRTYCSNAISQSPLGITVDSESAVVKVSGCHGHFCSFHPAMESVLTNAILSAMIIINVIKRKSLSHAPKHSCIAGFLKMRIGRDIRRIECSGNTSY